METQKYKIDPESKHPCIYADEDCSVYIEMCDKKPFIHATVYSWTPSKYKEFKAIWQKTLDAFWRKGYTTVYAPDMGDKITKFAKMFGFKETPHKIIGEDLKVRRVLECHQQ